MWQYAAAVEGYIKATTPEDGKMSSSEVDEVWRWMQDMDGTR